MRAKVLDFAGLLIIGLAGSAQAADGWKMILPEVGSAAPGPALMEVADFDKSDPEIAGLMFRCSRKSIETVVVLLEPMPPRSTASVGLTVGSNRSEFEASTIPTGAGLLVPFDPSIAVETNWANQRDLTLNVQAAGKTMKAVLDLAGLAPAIRTLTQTCASASDSR